MTLENRVAVVTGASEGIGRGIAMALAKAGADVVVASRRHEVLEEVADDIVAEGRRSLPVVVDVTDVDSIREARDMTVATFGRIDILVNDAGFSVNRLAWEITEEDWDRVIDTGPKGTFFCSQMFGVPMRDAGYGKIVNLSSTLSQGFVPGASVYGMSKAAISYLTKCLAAEWASSGVRVNAIAPASTHTPSRLRNMTPEREAGLIARIPLGRVGTVEDILPMALYLAGSESDFVTGQTFFVDGGWTAIR